jgi:signal transduction histidine kinase
LGGWQDGSHIHLEIRAPGVETSATDLAKMFEPFASHLPAGSGLGLASVRRITQAAGGAIQARSEPVRGTWLHLSFPCA